MYKEIQRGRPAAIETMLRNCDASTAPRDVLYTRLAAYCAEKARQAGGDAFVQHAAATVSRGMLARYIRVKRTVAKSVEAAFEIANCGELRTQI